MPMPSSPARPELPLGSAEGLTFIARTDSDGRVLAAGMRLHGQRHRPADALLDADPRVAERLFDRQSAPKDSASPRRKSSAPRMELSRSQSPARPGPAIGCRSAMQNTSPDAAPLRHSARFRDRRRSSAGGAAENPARQVRMTFGDRFFGLLLYVTGAYLRRRASSISSRYLVMPQVAPHDAYTAACRARQAGPDDATARTLSRAMRLRPLRTPPWRRPSVFTISPTGRCTCTPICPATGC